MLQRRQLPKKGNLAILITLLVATVIAMVMLGRCGSSSRGGTSGGDTLDVAIEFTPMNYYSYDDTLGGFTYDLLRHLAAQHGRPMKFHPITTLEVGLEGLETGTYDIVVAQFPVTGENKQRYAFTSALYLDNQVLLQRRAQDGTVAVNTQLDLAHDTVTIVKGSPMKERLAGLSREIGDTIYVAEDPDYGPEQLMMMVAAGEVKLAVINEHTARSLAPNYPQVDISTRVSFSQFQALTLRHDEQALADTLSSWIDEAKATSFYHTLTSRYFNTETNKQNHP